MWTFLACDDNLKGLSDKYNKLNLYTIVYEYKTRSETHTHAKKTKHT